MQKKSHEVLLKLLNNIGVVGAILCAVADIIFVIIMVFGIKVEIRMSAMAIFAVVNALVGLMINFLLRYQGKKYAEIENEELCKAYYNKRVREVKYVSFNKWMTLQTFKDAAIKGGGTAFSIFGLIYISVEGSENPIQLLLTLVTLVLFACFGLMSMNSAYERFYNVQIPFMKMQLEERKKQAEQQENNTTSNSEENKENPDVTISGQAV